MVEMNVVEKASSENLNNIQVLPTPESPMSSNLNNRSYVFFAISLLLRVNEALKKTKQVEPVEHDLRFFQTMFRTSNALNDYRFQGRTRARLGVQRSLFNDGKTGHRGWLLKDNTTSHNRAARRSIGVTLHFAFWRVWTSYKCTSANQWFPDTTVSSLLQSRNYAGSTANIPSTTGGHHHCKNDFKLPGC